MFSFGNMFDMPQTFNTQYKCYSVSMLAGNERDDVEKGGKIILPPSALDFLTRLNIVYPMLFKLTNNRAKSSTHCGVLEFVADEGRAYIPHWMMQNLYLKEGDMINIQSASLKVATFARFQPQTVDFLDISNPKAVLENVLRTFACLSKGDMLAIKYNEKMTKILSCGKVRLLYNKVFQPGLEFPPDTDPIYELLVLQTKPDDAVSIIECDMQVDFAPPVGYVQPQVSKQQKKTEDDVEPSLEGVPEEFINRGPQQFPGSGTRLDGKRKKTRDCVDGSQQQITPTIIKRGIPDLGYKVGTLVFKRKTLKPLNENDNNSAENFKAFGGHGQAIRNKSNTVK